MCGYGDQTQCICEYDIYALLSHLWFLLVIETAAVLCRKGRKSSLTTSVLIALSPMTRVGTVQKGSGCIANGPNTQVPFSVDQGHNAYGVK